MLNWKTMGLVAAVGMSASMVSLAAQEQHSGDDRHAEISAEAREIHQSGMLFDGHNDLPWTMRVTSDPA